MDRNGLSNYLDVQLQKASKISATDFTWAIGIAIPLPGGLMNSDKAFVTDKLSRLQWSFELTTIGTTDFVVLFPLGKP